MIGVQNFQTQNILIWRIKIMTIEHAVKLLKYGSRMPDFCASFNCIDEACEIACQSLLEKIESEKPKPIPYKKLDEFVYRPVFIVYGGIKMWTILNSINETSAHFSQSSDFGVYLKKNKCGITWFAYEREPKERD